MINVAILGGSGYTGGELIRLLLAHPGVRLIAVASRRLESRPLAEALPWLEGLTEISFTSWDAVMDDKEIELVFTALGHTESAKTVADLIGSGKKVVDLSADFRFRDPDVYEKWYGQKHSEPDLLKSAVYGLPELNRRAISETMLVANPGCYATAVILGLLPLFKSGVGSPEKIIVDAKSGVSGAGRTPRENTVFPECHEDLRPYAVAHHRHQPEIEMSLTEAAGSPVSVLLVPHLVPVNRGILATIYVERKEGTKGVRDLYEQFYKDEPFVKVSPEGFIPGIQDVKGCNYCRVAVKEVKEGNVIIFSAIDNLVKGASGQAVQNMNIMTGLPETSGLTQLALSP